MASRTEIVLVSLEREFYQDVGKFNSFHEKVAVEETGRIYDKIDVIYLFQILGLFAQNRNIAGSAHII